MSTLLHKLFQNPIPNTSVIVVTDSMNSFRDGNDLNLGQLDNISDAVCWFVAVLGLKEPSQSGEIVPLKFHFINSRFCSTHGLLHCCDFLKEIGPHPKVVFLQLVRFRGWIVIKNNKTCNALKCLKPSGLIDWINCRLCNGWVQMECASLSRTEARSLAKFKCSGCSLVNIIPQCQDDNFRPDTLFNSEVVHLKIGPKISRIPLAENLIPKDNDIRETPSNSDLWCLLLSSLSCFLETPPRGGNRQRSSLSAIINKRIRDGVIEKKNRNATENRSNKAS